METPSLLEINRGLQRLFTLLGGPSRRYRIHPQPITMAEQGLSTHGRNQGLGAQDEKDGAPSSQSSAPAQQNGDAAKHAEDQEKNDPAQAKKKASDKEQKSGDDKEPAGGFDATPFPPSRDGFTIRFTFHRAENLPISDLNSRSTDAYVHATLTCPLPKRHKEDPDITWRTPTIHKNVNPEWNSSWTVSGVPSSGFKLKCRLYDEDEADHDDRLGNVSLVVNQVGVSWSGVKEQRFQIKKKTGSKRAYGIRACGAMFSKNIHMNGHLYLSAEVLGESEKPYGRMYTIAETAWTKHYSPMIGRIAGTKAPGSEVKGSQDIEKYEYVYACKHACITIANTREFPSKPISAPRSSTSRALSPLCRIQTLCTRHVLFDWLTGTGSQQSASSSTCARV